VTLPDVGATVLDALGIARPDSMNATPITASTGSPLDAARLQQLTDANTIAVFRDRTVGPVSVIFVVLQVLTYFVVTMAFARRRTPGPVVALALGVILAVPPLTFLSGLVRYDRLGLAGYVAALFGVAVVLAALLMLLGRRRPLAPVLALVALNWLVQVVDIVLGGNLQLDTPLGYSPIVAGRFQGFGNLAFALLASAAIVLAAALVRYRNAWAAALALLAITVVADGWPAFGSDVGGVLACVPAFALLVMMLRRWRVSVRRAVVTVLAAIGVVLVFALVDLARPADQRTHLGRFVASLGNGDAWLTLRRKVVANVHILTSSVFTLLVPLLVIGFVIVVTRRRGLIARVQEREPALRAAMIASVVLGVLGFALNDSGIAIPAMMIGVVVPWLVVVTISILGADP
jgi:hypothetical protein